MHMTGSEATRATTPGPTGGSAAPAPVYHAPEKVREDEVRRRPGIIVDTTFFLVATVAAAWLAFRLFEDSWRHTGWHLALLIPFWAVVAYLVLPRIHRMLAAVYVPPYFIGRSRTSDGLLGDPVNLAVDGTARQIHEAMTRAGWVLADDITARSSWAIVVSSVFKRSYPEAPVSPLLLFGRQQSLAYQQEVEGNAAQRHHMRFWRCPDGWLLPGGRRVQWLGGGTYDRSVGLSLFTLQITHKIDADIDIERDYIVDSVRHYNPEVPVDVIADFSTGYHHRNGGGDLIRTDGDLPVLDLTGVAVPERGISELPPGVLRASQGFPVATDEGGVVAADPDRPAGADEAPQPGSARPASIVVACVLTALLALSALVALPFSAADASTDLGPEFTADQAEAALGLLMLVLGGCYLAMVALAVLTFYGRSRPRVWLMAVTTAALVGSEAMRISGALGGDRSGADDAVLAVGVIILLTLTAPAASEWSRNRLGTRTLGRRRRQIG